MLLVARVGSLVEEALLRLVETGTDGEGLEAPHPGANVSAGSGGSRVASMSAPRHGSNPGVISTPVPAFVDVDTQNADGLTHAVS